MHIDGVFTDSQEVGSLNDAILEVEDPLAVQAENDFPVFITGGDGWIV